MNQARKHFFIIVILFLCMVLGSSFVYGSSIRKPVIYSYYWPISDGQHDLLNWNMETPNIIDIPRLDNPKWLEAKLYWEKRGKTILYRVNPFGNRNKWFKTDDEMYGYFAKNMEESKGIAVDEIITHKLTKAQADMFINVLKRVRLAYPTKIIAVWCSGNWTTENSFVLKAIGDYADMVLPELYISQRAAAGAGFGIFKDYLKNLEKLVPGISKKTVVGIGMFPKMISAPSNFVDHLSAQIKLLGTDPAFKSILGIALYAPVYLTAEDQQKIDSVIKEYFSR